MGALAPVDCSNHPARHPGAGTYNRREDQSTAARTSDASDTTKPISHPWEPCELMITAIATAMPTMPTVATPA